MGHSEARFCYVETSQSPPGGATVPVDQLHAMRFQPGDAKQATQTYELQDLNFVINICANCYHMPPANTTANSHHGCSKH